jgi:3-oxoacyl-[acyl-carrier-protein] synthase II
MTDGGREAWITGIGIVSCLGEGPDAHWQGLNARRGTADIATFAPYVVHPLAPINLDLQIPKKGDQRQMEPWQRIGTYAAGLALDHARVKGDADLLGRMDMIVAAGGGERDTAVDGAILTGIAKAADPEAYLNERLMSDLRPTLFLAQLSNLLAGNISIVHGVTGSSRTFMGEESSGVDAVRIALSRIASGESDIALIGGSRNAERKDMLLNYAFGASILRGNFAPVWKRGPNGGFAFGSIGAFLVIEARGHAEARAVAPLAKLTAVMSERAKPGSRAEALSGMWDALTSRLQSDGYAVISGATGAEPATSEERRFLDKHSKVPTRATGTRIGHGIEPQFPANVALAALALSRGKLFEPDDDSGFERPMDGPLAQVVVTSVGIERGEGMALLEAVR